MSTRNARATRRRLLEVGQEEIYLHSFQGASLEQILGVSHNVDQRTYARQDSPGERFAALENAGAAS
jgi:hypothetical protein